MCSPFLILQNADAVLVFEELRCKAIIVFNKVDLNSLDLRREETEACSNGVHNNIGISCKTNQGVSDFLENLSKRVASL